MTIQEQVEQFVKDYWQWDDDYKNTTLYQDTLVLLRQFIGDIINLYEYKSMPERLHFAEKIRTEYAWLLK